MVVLPSTLEIERRVSFRGRKFLASARWEQGVNTISYNLNIMGWDIKNLGFEGDELAICVYFVCIDFHEWLHIWIRWESGIRGRSNQRNNRFEKFIKYVEDFLLVFFIVHGRFHEFGDKYDNYWANLFISKEDKKCIG